MLRADVAIRTAENPRLLGSLYRHVAVLQRILGELIQPRQDFCLLFQEGLILVSCDLQFL